MKDFSFDFFLQITAIWVFLGIVCFFFRYLLDGLLVRKKLPAYNDYGRITWGINGLTQGENDEIFVSFLFIHVILMPIGFFLFVFDLIKSIAHTLINE